jgi:hypothetical protein
MHAPVAKTWAEAAGLPETSARLERLPEGLTFPEGFPAPIRYDAARRLLVYRGFMTSTRYSSLHALSADPAYLAALDALYRDSAYTLADRPSRRWVWWLLGLACLGTVGVLVWLLKR